MQNEQQDQIQGPVPPTKPANSNMDANEDTVRSVAQLLKRSDSDPGPYEPRRASVLTSSLRNGKFLAKDDDPEVPKPNIIRHDSIASRASNKAQREKRIKDLVLKISVIVLFILILCGLIVIFHFHQLELHMLHLSQKIQLNEDNRMITIERNSTVKALVGRLGMNLPDYEWPLDCSNYSNSEEYMTHKCLRWNKRAQVDIYLKSNNISDTLAECHSIHWQELPSFEHRDCYLLDDATWIGGGILWQEDFLSSRSNADLLDFVTAVTPNNGGAGQVLEPFWISSQGVSIFVNHQVPLSVSVKKLEFQQSKLRKFKHIKPPPNGRYMCLAPNTDQELKLKFQNATRWLNYTVCAGSNMKIVQQYAMKFQIPKLRPLTDYSIFINPLFSPIHLPAEFTQENITEFAKMLNEAGLKGTLMIQPGWETTPGDFIFDQVRFPNVTEMMDTLDSYDFMVNLPVHPYVGVHSRYFGPHSDLGLFIMDGTGRSPGLTRWNCPNCGNPVVAVFDLSQSRAADHLRSKIENLKETVKPNFFSFYGGDAASLPYMAYQSGPQVNQYTALLSEFAANTTDTVFLQTAFSAQQMNPFLLMNCDNSTWGSLKVLLKRVLTVGMVGYRNVVQGPIGGCDPESVTEDLYIRWLQLGSFLPVVHLSEFPSNFSSSAKNIFKEMMEIRQQKVVPTIIKILNNTEENLPLIRPLWWVEPKSAQALKAEYQFMVGDDIMVAPVLTQNAPTINIFLPRGHWTYGWNSTSVYIGPRLLMSFKVDLGKIPYFIYRKRSVIQPTKF